MNESPAQQTLPESTPAGELERLIREADQTHKAHRSAVLALSQFRQRHLFAMPPTDSNLDVLFDALDTIRALAREINLPAGPDGVDELATIEREIGRTIDRWQLAGCFSWRDPAALNTDFMPNCVPISLTPAMQQNMGSLHGIHLTDLPDTGDAGRRLAEYLHREVSAADLELVGVAIMPGNCRQPPVDSPYYVGQSIVRFVQIKSLIEQEATFIRAEKARREEAERQRSQPAETNYSTWHETDERRDKRHRAEADVAADQRRREATGRTT